MTQPDRPVALIDRQRRPIRHAAHKVGESSVEVGTHYYAKILDLESYIHACHLPKLGLRFFFGDPSKPIETRDEIGSSKLAPIPSYQYDRGIMEHDLRTMNTDMGCDLYEGSTVQSIDLKDGDQDHEVLCKNEKGEEYTLKGKWVVDALGRRRLLQNKLKNAFPSDIKQSASWWRLAGEWDIEKMVPKENKEWQDFTVDRRWYSTNHFCGRGYWFWIIPLSSGNTSFGIVADEKSIQFPKEIPTKSHYSG